MKKTITQRFFLSLCLMIVGCLGGAAWAETVTYTITSSSAVSTSGTAPTGSSATFKNTYTTKDQMIGGKTMTLTLSGYAGKSISGITLSMKSNKTAGAGYLSVTAGETQLATIGSSSNGITFEDGLWNGKYTTTYTDVKPSMSNSSYVIQNGENVVIVIGATINSLYCESFTLTYEDHTPALTVSSNSISFGYVETKSSGSTQSFTLSGKNLTPNSKATLTLNDEPHFSVSQNTVDVGADGKIVSTDIEVAYAPTTIGQHSATLRISSGTISEIISLTGRGVDSETNYTISWMVNDNSYTKGEPTTKVAAGYQVATLPTNPAAIGSKVFMGWTASTISGTYDDAPADLFTTAENAPDVTSNTTYYAVFASATAGDSYWEEIKTAPEVGKYAILSDSYFMSSTITSSRFKNGSKPQISSTTPATLTTAPTEDCIWEITKPDSYYRIANGGQYAGGTTSKNEGAMLSNESNNFAKWTIEYSGTQFNVVNYGRSLQSSYSSNKYLRNNTTNGWACYASTTGKAPRLFKETTPYTYSDYATTVATQAAGLVFEQATYTAEVEEVITVKATNASGAAITYSVDDKVHAAVYENGEFMADAAGTYTITATCPATETHMAGTATCQVTVTLPASNIHATTYYKKITSTDELVDGGQYVIVYAADKKGLLAGESNISDATPADVAFATNGTITTANAAAMTEITFEKNDADGNYYLNIGDGKYIKADTEESTSLNIATGTDNNALWTIDFDASGNVEITSKAFSNRGIMYSTDIKFKNYAVSLRGKPGYPAIQLYQKVGEMPIAQVTGGITTYVADFAYAMPQHLVGHTVTLADNTGVITTYKAFRAGDEVPALTPLLIKSTEDYATEETSKTYNPVVLNKTVAAYAGDNMLEYRRDESNKTKSMKTGSVYYYKLAIKDGNVGFYWGAEDGAAFKMTKPSTAYLTVPKTMSVQGFVLNLEEGETTGIATVTTDENAPIYNLQGIRMNGKNLPKGIYIQGGKKFMVK